jgi:hypothetical protein
VAQSGCREYERGQRKGEEQQRGWLWNNRRVGKEPMPLSSPPFPYAPTICPKSLIPAALLVPESAEGTSIAVKAPPLSRNP